MSGRMGLWRFASRLLRAPDSATRELCVCCNSSRDGLHPPRKRWAEARAFAFLGGIVPPLRKPQQVQTWRTSPFAERGRCRALVIAAEATARSDLRLLLWQCSPKPPRPPLSRSLNGSGEARRTLRKTTACVEAGRVFRAPDQPAVRHMFRTVIRPSPVRSMVRSRTSSPFATNSNPVTSPPVPSRDRGTWATSSSDSRGDRALELRDPCNLARSHSFLTGDIVAELSVIAWPNATSSRASALKAVSE